MADPIDGANQLEELGRRLKEAGNGALRRELLAGIRTVVKTLIPPVQQGAEDRLPRSGGLAARVAGQKFAARTSLASGRVSLRGENGMKSLSDIDKGHLRHPIFGMRSKGMWRAQSVTPGFFSNPIEIRIPKIREGVDQVMSDVAKKLGRPLL